MTEYNILSTLINDTRKYKYYDNETLTKLVSEAQSGNINSRNKIMKSFVKYIMYVVRNYMGKGLSYLDLISEGQLGLIHAIDKYNPDKETSFVSYATYWIRQYASMALYWKGSVVRLPVSQHVRINKIYNYINQCYVKDGEKPTNAEIAKALNYDESEIEDILALTRRLPVSLDMKITDDEGSCLLQDIIPAEEDPDTENNDIKKLLRKVINTLPNKEHDIIRLMYGIDVEQTPLAKIADMFNVCEIRIRQLKDRALERLALRCPKYLKQLYINEI